MKALLLKATYAIMAFAYSCAICMILPLHYLLIEDEKHINQGEEGCLPKKKQF